MGPWPWQEPTAVNQEQHAKAADITRRPWRVTVAAAALIIRGVFSVLLTGVTLQMSSQPLGNARGVVGWAIFMALAQIASGVFVWNGRPWARMLPIVILSTDIFIGLLLALRTGHFAGGMWRNRGRWPHHLATCASRRGRLVPATPVVVTQLRDRR